MATADKHRKRSHRSYHYGIPLHMFNNMAAIRKEKTERQNLFKQLIHRGGDRGNG